MRRVNVNNRLSIREFSVLGHTRAAGLTPIYTSILRTGGRGERGRGGGGRLGKRAVERAEGSGR